jgi:hypothetical protein
VSLPKAAILTFTSRVMRAIPGFVKAPMLPYAAPFEAEILRGMRRKREYFEPDTFATEAPFLDDSWPRVRSPRVEPVLDQLVLGQDPQENAARRDRDQR